MFGAIAENSEPIVKTAMDIKNIRLTPKMSPILPASGIMAVPANWFTPSTQEASISETWKWDVRSGKATETVVPLMDTIKKAMLPTAKTIYRFM